MKVSTEEFRPYIDGRSDAEYGAVRVAVVAHGDVEHIKERSPLGFVLAVALSLMCWAALALFMI